MNKKNQNGVSLIAAVFIIVVLAFMGVMFLTMVNTGSFTAVNDLQSTQALYVAEGGLERALYSLMTPTLSDRIVCSSVTGSTAFTAKPLGQGQFTVTTGAGSPFYPANPVTFTNIAGTTINVNADPIARGYTSSGRIMIDRELIDYYGTAGNSFLNAVRERDGTTASTHANGTSVGQYQCTATSTGGIPTVAAPSAQRQVTEGIQLQEGWVVGGSGLPIDNLNSVHCTDATHCWAVGNAGKIIGWDGVSWREVASPTVLNLNEVHCADANNCWAVGAAGATADKRPLFLRWNGATWTQYDSTALSINLNLYSVHCVSPSDCWAVGNDGTGASQQPFILWWNGATWATRNSNLNINNINLNSVNCVATNNCWAVGTVGVGASQNPFILWWNGATWATRNSNLSISLNLNSIDCVSTNDCWAVGNDGTGAPQQPFILWWNGATWATRNSNLNINNINLNSVNCVATNNCWAVGTVGVGASQNPFILWWNGATWATRNSNLNINTNLNSVSCVNTNNCWAVGDGGNIFYWNGAAWSKWQQPADALLLWRDNAWADVSIALPLLNSLYSVSMLSYADGWAVGNSTIPGTNRATLLRWNGITWNDLTATLPANANQNLNSISMVSSISGFAVGNYLAGGSVCGGANNLPEILRWDGAAWNCVTSPAEDANHTTNLVAVIVLDTNNDGIVEDGWAFGANGWSTQLRWNNNCTGTTTNTGTWAECSGNNMASGGFNAVSMVTSTYGWAVGNIGPALGAGECAVGLPALGNLNFDVTGNWNWACPGVWPVNAARAANLMGVFMISITDGWAVGAVQPTSGGRPTILRWDTPCGGGAVTGQWNDCTNATYVPAINQQLNSVYCVDANDCWAVGNAGVILHWNGSTWSQVQAGLTLQNLFEVYVIGPKQRPQAAWQEVVK